MPKHNIRTRRLYIFSLIGLIITLSLASFLVARSYHKLTKPTSTISTQGSANTSRSTISSKGSESGNNNKSDTNKTTAPSSSGAVLTLNASQTLVSNHTPGADGSSTTEQSVCNTTPGASCYIKFTNGSLTRLLDTKTASTDGSVIWNWDVKGSGFQSGSWQITAVASLNGDTKTVTDPRMLVIQ